MSYNTRYILTWQAPMGTPITPSCECPEMDVALHSFCPACGKKTGYTTTNDRITRYLQDHSALFYAIHDDGKSCGAVTWYDYDDHMRDLSKAFPGVLFTLTGDGEEPRDIWVHYFKDGRGHKGSAKIVYPPFDEHLLARAT